MPYSTDVLAASNTLSPCKMLHAKLCRPWTRLFRLGTLRPIRARNLTAFALVSCLIACRRTRAIEIDDSIRSAIVVVANEDEMVLTARDDLDQGQLEVDDSFVDITLLLYDRPLV